jgi:8-oxo-dGTP diphosphatase
MTTTLRLTIPAIKGIVYFKEDVVLPSLYESKSQYHERHVFHLEVQEETAERWEYKVNSEGEDAGLIFFYYWVPVGAVPKLAANQDDCINQLFV